MCFTGNWPGHIFGWTVQVLRGRSRWTFTTTSVSANNPKSKYAGIGTVRMLGCTKYTYVGIDFSGQSLYWCPFYMLCEGSQSLWSASTIVWEKWEALFIPEQVVVHQKLEETGCIVLDHPRCTVVCFNVFFTLVKVWTAIQLDSGNNGHPLLGMVCYLPRQKGVE